MEKEFIPYELALRMKQLGFDEPCFNLYHLNRRELMYVCPNIGEVATYKYDNHNKTNHISAPTFSQTFRWFREKHNLKSFIQPIPDDVDTYIFAYGTKEFEHYDLDYLTHEEAELDCLKKLIEIIESKTK
jgi:hypothetical protein